VIPLQAPDGRWRPHLTGWLAYLKLHRSYWLVVNELCRRQGGSRAVVRAGALSLATATGLHERTIYKVLRQLIDLGLLEPVWLGGGSKNPGGAGLATEYRLAQRARRQPGTPHLEVVKKGGVQGTLLRDQKGGVQGTLSGDQKGGLQGTPDKREYDSLRSSSPVDQNDGRNAAPITDPIGPDDRPGHDPGSPGHTPPPAIPDRPQGSGSRVIDEYIARRRAATGAGVMTALLKTEPVERTPELELKPPKRRR
jgi:hypothetical protein